jgi:hypothetical protein
MPTTVPDPDAWYEEVHGIPRPNWTLFNDWITTEADAEDFDGAWDTMIENWMRRVAPTLGPEYRVAKSEHLTLLSPHTERECKNMLVEAERGHARITRLLAELSIFHYGRVLVLRLPEPDHYYRYIAHGDDTEGDAPMSGGVFINKGFPHVVCHSRSLESFCSTVSHEMAHFYTDHLSHPRWVSEGIAMIMEPDGGKSHLPTRTDIDLLRTYWTEDTIQQFWSGESWARSDKGFGYSYRLAAMLFEIIRTELSPPSEAFRAFIRDAHRDDGGAEAARKNLRADLEELAEVFLGPGDWAPRSWR